MVFLYIYLSGVVAVMLLWIFLEWFRPKTKIDVAECLFSWILVAIVISVYTNNWKLIREVRKMSDEELLKEEEKDENTLWSFNKCTYKGSCLTDCTYRAECPYYSH